MVEHSDFLLSFRTITVVGFDKNPRKIGEKENYLIPSTGSNIAIRFLELHCFQNNQHKKRAGGNHVNLFKNSQAL